jgi:hypothetical protein
MKNERDLGDIESADLSFLWESYKAELENLNASLDYNDSKKITEDLEDLMRLNKIFLNRSLNQRLEFYHDLRREQKTAIQAENDEYARDLKRQLIYYQHAFLEEQKGKVQRNT